MSRWLQIALEAEEKPKAIADTLQEPAERSEGLYVHPTTDTLQKPAERGLGQAEPSKRDFLQVPAVCRADNPNKLSSPSPLPANISDMRHGFTIGCRPLTWTGKVVSLEEWRGLTDWEKHGPDGKHWNALTQKWEAPDE